MAKTASDLADTLAGLGEQIRTAAITETRRGLAAELKAQFTASDAGTQVMEVLDDDMPASVRKLRGKFEAEGVSAEFLAGIRFAASLVADERYEF